MIYRVKADLMLPSEKDAQDIFAFLRPYLDQATTLRFGLPDQEASSLELHH